MAPLLTLFLVALVGLPLGKMEGGTDPVVGGLEVGREARSPWMSLLSLLSGPGKVVGLGV